MDEHTEETEPGEQQGVDENEQFIGDKQLGLPKEKYIYSRFILSVLKGLISQVHKQLIQLNNKKITQSKNGQKT